MNHRARIVVVMLSAGLAACSHAAPPVQQAARPAVVDLAQPPTPARPAGLRLDLAAHWIDQDGQLQKPANDGFNAPPVRSTLQPDRLIDQFGESGRIFSPKGEPFAQRSLPTECDGQRYRVYRVLQPLPVTSGKTIAWFDEPGGATRYETDEAADALVTAHILEPVLDAGPAPCVVP